MSTTRIYSSLLAVALTGSLVVTTTQAAETVATVNGKAISKQTLDQYTQYRLAKQGGEQANIPPQALLNELINRELLKQAALKAKLDKDKEVAFQIEQLKTDALIQAVIAKNVDPAKISDKEVKAEYDSKIGSANLKEYKASHILLKSEAEAKAAIAELDSGAVFADVAKAKSTGPTAANGGDLGWFKPNQMVPPFAQAVSEMKKGTYTKTPVQTQFGWHVIKLEDERKLTPPKYDDVKEQIRAILANQKMQQYVMDLRNKAKVEIK